MKYIFVKDFRHKYRFFSPQPISGIDIAFSRWKELWEKAKARLMLLPKRVLAQEQAFEKAPRVEEGAVEIFYSGHPEEKKVRSKFYFFLQRQRSKHVLLLIAETLLLPLSGLMALLPGPNVFFGVLALVMITHWQALKGINRLLKKEFTFIPHPLLGEWETAVADGAEGVYAGILDVFGEEIGYEGIRKILWR